MSSVDYSRMGVECCDPEAYAEEVRVFPDTERHLIQFYDASSRAVSIMARWAMAAGNLKLARRCEELQARNRRAISGHRQTLRACSVDGMRDLTHI